MDPNHPGYPAPSQGNLQQFPYYPNQMPSFPQSNASSQPFNAVPLQPGGAMMPPSFPQQSPGTHTNFSSFSQPPVTSGFNLPTTSAMNIPTTHAQSLPQNTAPTQAKNLVPAQQQISAPQAPTQNTAAPVPGQSPPAAAREKERIAVLLEINSMLLQEAINLQSSGKTGPSAQQAGQDSNPSQTSETSDKSAQHNPEYANYMRRLQANLGYLATVADKGKKSGGVIPPAPAIMTPPPNLPAINDLYTKLNELFPRVAQGAASTNPSAQGSQSSGGQATSGI